MYISDKLYIWYCYVCYLRVPLPPRGRAKACGTCFSLFPRALCRQGTLPSQPLPARASDCGLCRLGEFPAPRSACRCALDVPYSQYTEVEKEPSLKPASAHGHQRCCRRCRCNISLAHFIELSLLLLFGYKYIDASRQDWRSLDSIRG